MDEPTQDKPTTANNEESDNATTAKAHLPGELYRQTFDQILTGLLASLKQHRGTLDDVTIDDIVENGNVDPVLMDRYFNSTRVIMNEVISVVRALLAQAGKETVDQDPTSTIVTLLQLLIMQPLMVEVLLASGNHSIWENNLKPIAIRLSPSWPAPDEARWNDVYPVFCFQFQRILKKWSDQHFSEAAIPTITSELLAWISADELYLQHMSA